MDLQQFEQAVLTLAFETDARITTASVAYYLGIPTREANRLLNQLLEEGALELDSDESGNLYYRVPHHDGSGEDLTRLKDLRGGEGPQQQRSRPARPADRGEFPPPCPPRNPTGGQGSTRSPAPAASRYMASPEDDGGVEALSPRRAPAASAHGATAHAPGHSPRQLPPAPSHSHAAGQGPVQSGSWGGFGDHFHAPTGQDGDPEGQRQPRAHRPSPRAVWSGVAARIASPDASVDRCGSSTMVVGTEVRCEPRPLPSSRPTIVSCNDDSPAQNRQLARSRQDQRDHMWFGHEANSSALVATSGETALSRDYYIEQPEHQPGMALLLSLILCGTGQIYNGEVSKGIMMMVLCFLLWFVLLGWVVHIWSIVDAVVVAERLNRKRM